MRFAHPRSRGTVGRKVLLGALAALIVFVVGLAVWLGPVVASFNRAGFFEKAEQQTYEGTSADNLRALHTALMLYQESEGQLPQAAGWMDAAKTYVRTADLLPGQEMRKFVHPDNEGKDQAFGYAMNPDAESKPTAELPPTTVLLFESEDPAWNAHAQPEGQGLAITLAGEVIDLAQPPKTSP